MRGGDEGLTVAYLGVRTNQVAVTADDLLVLRIPDDELVVRLGHRVHLVDVHLFAGCATSVTITNLAQTGDLAHHIRALVRGDVIDEVVRLVGRAKQVTF